MNSLAGWFSWMKKYMVISCAGPATSTSGGTPQSIGAVTFDYNSFTVKSKEPAADAANQAAIQAVANALRANPTAAVVLHGFSDGKGKPDYNLKLSKKRAEAVAHYLMAAFPDSCGPDKYCGPWSRSNDVANTDHADGTLRTPGGA